MSVLLAGSMARPVARRPSLRSVLGAVLLTELPGCAGLIDRSGTPPEPALTPMTSELEHLPPPGAQFTVAVYGFRDLTGQRKPSETIADLSTAVTQGGASLLTDALLRAGNGRWFKVVEREGLQNLLQERQLIRATRAEYRDAAPLAPLLFAGAVLEGGIISYDTNTLTGGLGVRLFGIGANSDIRMDEVMVNLRLISVQSGQILRSVTVRKAVLSARLQGNFYRYVSDNKILEIEGGASRNEPAQFAVRQAIEKAVYSLILEGAEAGLWAFAEPQQGQPLIDRHRAAGGAAAAVHARAAP